MMSFATLPGGSTMRRLRAHGWGIFVTPEAIERNRPAWRWSQEGASPMPYAGDNGAWSAFVNGTTWDPAGFVELLDEAGELAVFVAVPDIVEGGLDSLEHSRRWLPRVLERSRRALVVVQDGMSFEDVRPMLSGRVGVFVGGSTEWKESTLKPWAALAQRCGAWCHVGRVNSVRRINMCTNSGVDSIDGTSAVRFSSNIGKLDGARRQLSFIGEME